MASETVRILNRNPDPVGLPIWFRSPLWLASVFWGGVSVFYLLLPPPPGGWGWIPWAYLALSAALAVEAWGLTINSFEIDADRFRVHYRMRSLTVPMNSILDVEAHRKWKRTWVWPDIPTYEIRIRRRKGLRRILGPILPTAGEQVLFALHGLQKPITVYDWR